jgi:2-(1,2-epoxy-1,2-dihydrophenyl)acetyl-CoA isomerase
MPDPLSVSLVEGVAHVTLERPELGNALNLSLAQALRSTVQDLATDERARVVVLAGRGKHFCVGGDLRISPEDDAGIREYVTQLTATLHAAIADLMRLEQPVIAVAHGTVAGAGVALLAASDLVVAGAGTQLKLAYAGVGLTPDCGLSYLLPRMVGRHRALDLLLTGRTLAAPEAQQWGLIGRLVPDEGLVKAAHELARRLARGPRRAFGKTKRLVVGALAALEAQMATESAIIAEQRLDAEGREGANAFFARRKATFS